jgi:hypothetical protein
MTLISVDPNLVFPLIARVKSEVLKVYGHIIEVLKINNSQLNEHYKIYRESNPDSSDVQLVA